MYQSSPHSTGYVNRSVTTTKSIYKTSSDEEPSWFTRLLLYIITSCLSGIALLYLIVGIIYLTIYYYPYPFTQFSTTLVAGLFIAWAGLLFIIVAANIFFIFSKRPHFILFTAIAAFILFVVLVAIGIWGLAVSVGANLATTLRQSIYNTVKYYDSSNPSNYATAAIDWMQETFDCCGSDSLQDWRVFYSLIYQQQAQSGTGYFPNQYNLNYNQQLTSTVPDSCCVNVYPNCGSLTPNYYQQQQIAQPWVGAGAQPYQYPSSYGNIYSQGCLIPFLTRYQRDLVFIAAYCFGVSVVGALVCLVYVGLFFFVRTRNS